MMHKTLGSKITEATPDKVFHTNFKILLESENFFVIPSEGALVPGWVLVIPKKFYLNFGCIPVSFQDELKFLIDKVYNILNLKFGSSVIFEHGPSDFKSKVGCGIDYAHLHIVPTKIDLHSSAKKYNEKLIWQEIQSISELRNYSLVGQEYLFIQDVLGNKFVGSQSEIINQFFRRVISTELGKPEMFDWREYSNQGNIQTTIEAFTS